jgi:hypothetical protein
MSRLAKPHTSLLLLIALATMASRPAHAESLESVAGWEGDSHREGYGYAGIGTAIPLGHDFAAPVGISVSYLYYGYDSTGTAISVQSPGASVTSGLRFHVPRASLTVTGGAEVRRENLNNDIAGSPTRTRTTTGGVGQFYCQEELARGWEATQFGVYVGAAQYMVGRIALRRQITNLDWKKPTSLSLGVEGVRQGNRFSDALQTGALGECNFVRLHMSLGVHLGYKQSWSPGSPQLAGAYLGTSFYRHF